MIKTPRKLNIDGDAIQVADNPRPVVFDVGLLFRETDHRRQLLQWECRPKPDIGDAR